MHDGGCAREKTMIEHQSIARFPLTWEASINKDCRETLAVARLARAGEVASTVLVCRWSRRTFYGLIGLEYG